MKFTAAKLKQLKDKNLPKCDWRDFINSDEPLPESDQKTLTEYFERFLPSSDECPCCKEKAKGALMATIGIGFGIEWGIKHGEGFCNKCNYPFRGMHYKIGPIAHLKGLFLAYHPNELEFKK